MKASRKPDLERALRPVPAFETHPGGFVTLRVPVIEFDGIDVDQVPLTDDLSIIEDGLDRA